ncbi:MAG: gliding motility-associated ABC transporter substrate-binding protein GldG [Bacteroidetes bacterium CG2_30_33_31]|nr:MAG: gliding motility-associated ABC transporter substrate-binding protein GldG [Bacteroidetes bacterium CG2_30_33_31]
MYSQNFLWKAENGKIMKQKNNNKINSLYFMLLSIAIIISINIISTFYFARLDLSSEKRFSLSKTTLDNVKNLEDVVFIQVYLDGDLPAGFKLLKNSVKEMLDEFRAYNKNVQYEFINPSANEDKKERFKVYKQLADEGLAYYNVPVENKDGYAQKTLFPSALITYKGKSLPLNLLVSSRNVPSEDDLNNSIQKLELNFSTILNKLVTKKVKSVAFTSGHGEISKIEIADIGYELSKSYNVSFVKLNGQLDALNERVEVDSINTSVTNKYDLIIIAKPDSSFNENDKFILDQYIMHGGKVVWLLDGISASMDSLYASTSTVGFPSMLNIDDIIFNYGVRINANLVLNRNALEIGTAEGVLRPWDFFPLALPKKGHIITNSIETIKTQFVSSLDTISKSGLRKTVLLSTDRDCRIMPAPAIIDIVDIIYGQPNLSLYRYPAQNLGVLIEGSFESAYKNRIIDPRISENKDFDIKYTSPETKMAFFSDGDIIRNQVMNQDNGNGSIPLPLGYDRHTKKMFDNKKFLMNTLNYMLGDTNLIYLRNKELKIRLLDKNKINNERLFWQITNTVLPIILIILLGLILNLSKKMKYSKK